jgi:hypothetical protein
MVETLEQSTLDDTFKSCLVPHYWLCQDYAAPCALLGWQISGTVTRNLNTLQFCITLVELESEGMLWTQLRYGLLPAAEAQLR